MAASNIGTESVEGIRDVFRCFICMEKLSDARLCPHCSKFCCFQCIRRWITEQRSQCPHCRSTLRVSDLVKCRWAEEITEKLDTLHEDSSSRGVHENDTCNLHQEKLSVFCWTCAACICHHCALWGGNHSGHTLKPVEDEYKHRVTDINAHARKLRRRLCTLIETMQTLEQNMDSIRDAKEERVAEIKCAVDVMVARIEQQMKAKLVSLTGQKRSMSMEVEMVEGVLSEVDHQLSTAAPSHLIHASEELLKMMAQIQRSPPHAPFHVDCEFSNEIVPPYESHVFVLQPFSQLRVKSEPVYSTPLNVNGLVWRLKVYPDGNGVVRGSYLSIFLELSNGPPEQARYEYRVEMLSQGGNHTNERNVVREFTSDFEVGECWGYNRFFKIDHLEPEGFLDLNTDSVVLNFMVRPPNYQQKCKDLQWYVNQLKISPGLSACGVGESKDDQNIRTTDLVDPDPDVEGVIPTVESTTTSLALEGATGVSVVLPLAPLRTSSLSVVGKLVENDVDDVSNATVDRDVDDELEAGGGDLTTRMTPTDTSTSATANRIQQAFRNTRAAHQNHTDSDHSESNDNWSVDALLDEDRRIDCPACSPRSKRFVNKQLTQRHRELMRDVPWLESGGSGVNSHSHNARTGRQRFNNRRRSCRGSRSNSLDLEFFNELDHQ